MIIKYSCRMYRRVLSRSNSNLVRVAQVNQVATVTIDNSPVNLLSRAVLTDIASTFDNLGNDESVKAVIMKSGAKGNIFCVKHYFYPILRRLHCWT